MSYSKITYFSYQCKLRLSQAKNEQTTIDEMTVYCTRKNYTSAALAAMNAYSASLDVIG